MTEIRASVEKDLKLYRRFESVAPTDDMVRTIPQTVAFLAALDDLQTAFTHDELVYLEYRRHVEAHPWQHGYNLQLSKNGLVDKKLVFGKQMVIEDIQAILQATIRKYGAEDEIAIHFATRAAPLTSKVFAECQRFCSPLK
jgi:hypothetical protein